MCYYINDSPQQMIFSSLKILIFILFFFQILNLLYLFLLMKNFKRNWNLLISESD
ncbi:unnamed protein product [Brassica rapa subsp. trilocularis]